MATGSSAAVGAGEPRLTPPLVTPAVLTAAADLPAAADLLTEAFFDNPGHVFIYPDAETRRRRLHWLMRTNLRAQFAVGQSFAARTADGAIAAMAFWHAPGAPQASPWQLARFGFFAMPLRHGWAAFQRMMTSVEELEARRREGLGGRESWYLNNMVVTAALRGSGTGTRLLREQLETVVAPSGHPASLTTQKPENVSFYRRLGFEVMDDRPIGGPDGYPNWIMVWG